MTTTAEPLRLLNSTVVKAHHGTFLAPRDDLVTRHLEEYGGHTRPFIAMAVALIESGDVVLDIGAHIGSFTIPFARAVWPDGVVVAFEPNMLTNELLEINSELNDLSRVIDIEPIALSDSSKTFAIHTRRDNTGASFLEPEESDESAITTSTLSEWFETAHLGTIDFLKIDVEGMEVRVLAGAEDLLERFKPILLVEVDESQMERYGTTLDELQDVLVESGYRMFLHTGPRNAQNDDFMLTEIEALPQADELYDVLAIHKESRRAVNILGPGLGDPRQQTEHHHAS